MFDKKRTPLLFWALGIAGAVVAAAGTGTWLFVTRGNKRAVTASAKRVVARATHKRKPSVTAHAKANHHPKTNHVNGHNAHAR